MRYIDADRLITKIHELYVQPNIELWQVVKCVGNSPTADVVPNSEVERLNAVMKEMDEQRAYTINMLGESLEKAKAEVERLQEELTKAEADVRNYMKVAEYQQSLSVKRYHEINRLKEDIDRLQDINNSQVENVQLAKQEVAKVIFAEIEKIIQDRKNEEFKRQGVNKMISPFTYSFGALEIIEFQIAELKKKYGEGEPNGN